jgi:dihydroxy-acid dehydratase
MNWPTAEYFSGPRSAHRRAVYKGMGYTDKDLSQPLVAVINTFSEVCPGHFHLRQVAQAVKNGVWQAGGTPFEFGTISQCATHSLGLPSMRYDLPARDLIAFDVETIVETQLFDAMLLVVTCDKTVPGALLAAARLDLPCIIVPGGVMRVGRHEGKKVSLADLDEKIFGGLRSGRSSAEEIEALEDHVCPGPGACPIMGTANTMQCLAEALGMALPYSATTTAASGEQLRLAKNAGRRIVEMIPLQDKARKIMGRNNLENMLRACMALGGSTNAVVHMLALACELGLEDIFNLDLIASFSDGTPCICDVTPTGSHYLDDLHRVGGVPALMAEMRDLLHLDAPGVSGVELRRILPESLAGAAADRREVIRSLDNPVAATGGLAVLKGSLAPLGSVARRLNNTIPYHKGRARCFDSQEEAVAALNLGRVKEGEVLVVRYCGPRGAPGMPDIYGVLAGVVGQGLEGKVAVVTDGRFSGFARGLGVCQISPEAAAGGPLAVVKDGDMIEIDLEKRVLNGPEEGVLAERLKTWRRPPHRSERGILGLYATNAQPAWKGARLAIYGDKNP